MLGGGKRFRPAIALLMGQFLGASEEALLPFAAAVEMIHTYSLIHDDLPCMDDDAERRGKPTNHIVFGEATALLAGDALLTESFLLLARKYSHDPVLARDLIELLGEAAGFSGMVGGQAIDLWVQNDSTQGVSESLIRDLHARKTGALIRVSVEGATQIALSTNKQNRVDLVAQTETDLEALRVLSRKFGELVGLAFQIADDLLDHNDKETERCSYTHVMGLEKTRSLLADVCEEAQRVLNNISECTSAAVEVSAAPKQSHLRDLLSDLVQFNLTRKT